MDWLEVLKARRHEIEGDWTEKGEFDWFAGLGVIVDCEASRAFVDCEASRAIVAMMREVPIAGVAIQIGPPLGDTGELEHHLSVRSLVGVYNFATDFVPGMYISTAGFRPFARDLDLCDDHFLGPHPETGELTVVQIYHRKLKPGKRIKAPVTSLRMDQCHVHTPTLKEFFETCRFMPRVKMGRPPRK